MADTIVALATAPLPAGVAVIRLSGPESKAAAQALCAKPVMAKPRTLELTPLHDSTGEPLDQALITWFKAPHSFTGEDVVEIHCHGGVAVVEGLLRNLCAHSTVRPAEAGEFSRRAFLNGKMDLTAAEGLADLVSAQTEAQRRQALRQMQGELADRFEAWRTRTLHLLAHTEAAIDFPDEELDVLAEAGLKEKLEALMADLEQATATRVGERLRDGFSIAIVGRPNAGKSTLTNLLTGRETAIVSPIAGTTRDVVEAHLNIGGYPVVISDTAGLRDTADTIEAEGVRRAVARATDADMVILVTSAHDWPTLDPKGAAALRPGCGLVLVSKVDEQTISLPQTVTANGTDYPVLGLNLKDASALNSLLAALEPLLATQWAGAREVAQISRLRHRQAIESALGHLKRAHSLYTRPQHHQGLSLSDLLAQDLRDAAAAIGRVTGGTSSEDVLDVVFSTFCIGK